MEGQPTKKYGLVTAIAMVVGIVIGSGVFFKAEAILQATGGDMLKGILAWVIAGAIMIICAYSFSVLAAKYEKVNGIVDYAEEMVGSRYSYLLSWFLTTIYYPCLTSVLAWVSARYACVLLGFDITGGACMVLSGFLLCASYTVNTLSPVWAGKFQVTTTVIKLIPLICMAVFGTLFGLRHGILAHNFTAQVSPQVLGEAYQPSRSPLLASVVAAAFAYEGWIIATSINAELKNAKKNLPRALIIGSLTVVSVYILYYIGISGGIDKSELISGGEAGVRHAFSSVFGRGGGILLMIFVLISCLGTLNGLMLACTRGMFSMAARGRGPSPNMFRQIDPVTDMAGNSAAAGLLLSAAWLVYFYGANLTQPWFGPFSFDSSELPIITLYAMYLPIFVMMIKREKGLSIFQRFVMPVFSCLGCLFMVAAALIAHRWDCFYYLILFCLLMLIGLLFSKKKT